MCRITGVQPPPPFKKIGDGRDVCYEEQEDLLDLITAL